MACENLVGGCFGGDRAPFASHQSDAERAAEYLACCVRSQMTWTEVENQIRDYLTPKGSGPNTAAWIDEQVAEARRRMAPWLK